MQITATQIEKNNYSPSLVVPHHLDENILIVSSMNEISEFNNDSYKGGFFEDGLPKDIQKELINLSDEYRKMLSGVPINLAHETGAIEFPKTYREAFSDNMLEYIEDFSKKFNDIGDWPAQFLYQTNLGTHQIAPSFHPDSWSADQPRQIRAFASVSSDKDGQKHETEVLMTDGLSNKQVRATFQHQGSHNDLHEIYSGRVRLMQSGDFLLLKGLGDGKSNILEDSLIHRGPPHKNTYQQEGKNRDTLMWQRNITAEPDLG